MKETNQTVDLEWATDGPVAYVEGSGIVSEIVDEYTENRQTYQTLKRLKGLLRKAQRGEKGSRFDGRKHDLARPLYIIAVASIQTPTAIWERETARWLDGEVSLEGYLEACEDSGAKLRCIARVEETDLLDKVNVALRQHHVLRAVELLSGKNHGIRTYLRGVKAWMVPTLMFNVGCMDTNVHTASKPLLMWNFDHTPIYHPDMSEGAKGQARAKAEKWWKGEIPPYERDFLNSRLSEYNDQYRLRETWKVVEAVVNDAGSVPRDVIPQVLFNVGGRKNNGDDWQRTIHAPIYEALGRNLERFRAE